MSEKTPAPPVGGKRARTRAKVVAAVQELLADGTSYTELSVGRIVAAAGISRSTFYAHFSDKGELLRCAVDDVRADIDAAGRGWWAVDATTTRDETHERLRQIVLVYQPHATIMAEVYGAASYDPMVADEVGDLIARSIAGLRRHIERGQEDGFVDPKLLPRETAAWLVWMAERCQHQVLKTVDPEELDRMADVFADLIWDVLYAPAAA